MKLNLQTQFINDLIKNQTQMSLYLQNGIAINGFILTHDSQVLIAKDMAARTQLIYKSAISSFIPKILNQKN